MVNVVYRRIHCKVMEIKRTKGYNDIVGGKPRGGKYDRNSDIDTISGSIL